MKKNALPMMSFIESVTTCFKKYATFKGRARRSEYWWFWILPYVVSLGSSYLVKWKLDQRSEIESQIAGALFDQDKQNELLAQAASVDSTFSTWGIILIILTLLLLLPSLAVLCRRLHDVGKSGWIILLNFIPVVNIVTIIITFIFTLMDSKPEPNKYGPSPKYGLAEPLEA